jgi:hypothetical protein
MRLSGPNHIEPARSGHQICSNAGRDAKVAEKATRTLSARYEDLSRRLERVEELARSNRKELDIQLQRIADLQAIVDSPLLHRQRRVAMRKGRARKGT